MITIIFDQIHRVIDNGVARKLNKLPKSKGGYCIKQ